MRKQSGAAAVGIFVLMALLIVLGASLLPNARASGSVTANITFNATSYFPRTTALITVNDTGGNASSTIIVNSSLCTQSVGLTESPSGTFTKVINFITSGTCTQSNLLVADGDSVFASYVDGRTGSGVTIVNRSFFNNTAKGFVVFNFTSLGTSQTGNVTVVDNDTGANLKNTQIDNISVSLNSTSGLSNITIFLNETSAFSGIFAGVFTINASGRGSSGSVLGVSPGDNITVLYNDSRDDAGIANYSVNISKAAQNGTVSSSLSVYYPASVVTITANDTDLDTNASSAQTVNVTVNATNAQMITLILTETGISTGLFTNNFSFGSSSSNATRTLFAGNRNLVNVLYNDTINFSGGNFTLNISAFFFNRTSGTITTDSSLYATNNTVMITIIDNDTCQDGIDPASCANKDQTVIDTVRVFVNSTSDPGGISFLVSESGVTTGNFSTNGNFTFNVTGRSSAAPCTANCVLNASNGDNLTFVYTDVANATGNIQNITATATFFTFTSGTIRLNGTVLNATETAFNVTQTVRINITDSDSLANANTSAVDNITVNITSPLGCSITINLTESGANTGVFDNTFHLSHTACSNTTRTVNVSAGAHSLLTIAYLDARNGTSQINATTINTTLIDDRTPILTQLVSLDSRTVFKIGETISLNLTIDQAGGNISGNFSDIDSTWTAGSEQVTDMGNGSYRINYTLASANTRTEGQKLVNITIRDAVGNGPINASIILKLSRTSANVTIADFGQFVIGQRKTAVFSINNTGTINQTSINEEISVFKRYNFSYHTTQNSTSVFFFMVPENTTSIKLNVTANNTNINLTAVLRNFAKAQISGVPVGTVTLTPASFLQVMELVVVTSNVSGVSVNVRPIVDVFMNFSYAFRSGISSLGSGSTVVGLNLSLPTLGILPQEFNGTIEYNNTNTSVTLNLSYNITAAQLWMDSNWSSPLRTYPNTYAPLTVNLNRGNKSLILTVNNTGNINLTGLYANLTSNFTSSANRTVNITNVTVGTGITLVSLNNISFHQLAPNTFTNLTFHFNTSEQAAGVYNATLIFNSTNGQPYNLTTLNLTLNVTADLNVTVLSVVHNSSTANPAPGTNLTINLSVKFQEGEPVTTLNASNVTMYDLTNTSQSYTIQNFNTSMNTSGIYWFNITVPALVAGKAQFGVHNMVVEARGPDSNMANGSFSYNMTAASLVVTPPDGFTLSASAASTKTFTVSNTGTGTVSNITINVTTPQGTATGNTTIQQLIPGASTTVSITITAPSTTTTYNVTVNASSGSFFGTGSVIVTMSNTSNASSSSSSSSSVSTGKTFVYEVKIISHDTQLSALLGTSNTTTITINNSGNLTSTFKVAASATDSGLSFATSPSACLIGSGVTCSINLTVSVANTTALGSHTVTLSAQKSDDPTIVDNKTLTLTVLSTPERQQQIALISSNITETVQALVDEFAALKLVVSPENASKVEILINESIRLLSLLNASLAAGDYATAESAIQNLTALSGQIRDRMSGLILEKAVGETIFVGSMGTWIIIGVVLVAIGGFLFYVLLPEQGFSSRFGYQPRGSFFYRAKSRLKRRKKRVAEGPRFSRKVSRLVQARKSYRRQKFGGF